MRFIVRTTILALLAIASASAGIVTNGGFEGGPGAISGWTIFNVVEGGFGFDECSGNPPPHSGLCEASVGSGGGSISQDVTTIPGQQYLVSFWLLGDQFSQFKHLTVLFGGVTVFNGSDQGPGYAFHSAIVAARLTDVFLTFMTSSQTSLNVLVDDVDVTAVPEPSTLWLISLSAVGLGIFSRRRVLRG